MRICPQCQHELALFRYEGIELWKCSACQGFWFEDGTFREAKRIGFAGLHAREIPEPATAAAPAPAAAPELRCPACAVPLAAFAYAYSSEIHLQRCAQCQGIWANAADLANIERLLHSYKESLAEAKAKALPLMLKVKEQFQQEEQAREAERQRKKKQGFFTRMFRKKESSERKIEDIFEDFHQNKHH